jgi:large subunit ribosomal protein L13
MMKTRLARKEDFRPETRAWYHVDAEGKILGRLATRVAVLLMGKNRPDYTPHVDTGAYVVVTNAEKVKLTGNKLKEKVYRRYSGYQGGLRERTAGEMLAKHPEEVFRLAVKRMLPKTKLGRHMLLKLKVYRGPNHPHTYAKPQHIDFA